MHKLFLKFYFFLKVELYSNKYKHSFNIFLDIRCKLYRSYIFILYLGVDIVYICFKIIITLFIMQER